MRNRSCLLLVVTIVLISSSYSSAAGVRDYKFDRTISRRVLENYLARAVTHAGLCSSSPDPTTACLDDDIRMLTAIGAKFVGRAAFAWYLPPSEARHFSEVKAAAAKVHEADPEIILQACIFETASKKVEGIPVPAWVFGAFGLPAKMRNFDYEAMLYDNGYGHNKWRRGVSVPDMSKLETRLWFYYRAGRYIDSGIEAIHFGQVKIMDRADPGHRHWLDMLERVRTYAHKHARRHLVLCDAHTHGEVENDRLLFDFHSYPLMMKEIKGKPEEAMLSMNWPMSHPPIYGRSKGGITPSGWSCKSLPYLVEFDNCGYSGKGGQSVGGPWVWGYDEISWFSQQDEKYRDYWLRYAWKWMREHDENGYLQMPTRRIILTCPIADRVLVMYCANTPSEACPTGFNVEKTIKDIWDGAQRRTRSSGSEASVSV